MSPILVRDEEERRSARRYKVNIRSHWAREASREYQGVVRDLSAGGCFVESNEGVQVGDLVKLRLSITGRGDLTIWGHVAFRIRKTGFGVRFTAFSQGGARERLAEILDEEERRS